MGATPSHEDDGDDVADPESDDDDDVIKIQNNRFRVSYLFVLPVISISTYGLLLSINFRRELT